MDFLTNNWEWCLIIFMVAEKLVKLSPTKYDDIVLDIVWKNIKKLVKNDSGKNIRNGFKADFKASFY